MYNKEGDKRQKIGDEETNSPVQTKNQNIKYEKSSLEGKGRPSVVCKCLRLLRVKDRSFIVFQGIYRGISLAWSYFGGATSLTVWVMACSCGQSSGR